MQPGSRELPSRFDVPVRRSDPDSASTSRASLQSAPLSVHVLQQQQQQKQKEKEEEQEQEQQPWEPQENKPSMHAPPSSSTPPAIHLKKWASEDEWTIHRPKICRLYLHERKTLKEVMAAMERDHDFYATYVLNPTQIRRGPPSRSTVCRFGDFRTVMLRLSLLRRVASRCTRRTSRSGVPART